MSTFFIHRRDLNLDPIVIETEGLTIGRLIGNDLPLNHPTVSRTHAGIRDVAGDYWIFNLSEANGTLVNGEMIDQTPLADGDLVQIGPFFVQAKYLADGLRLDIEMTVNPLPLGASATGQLPLPGETEKTVRLDPALLAQLQRQKSTPKGTRRLSGTGLLTGILQGEEAQALKIFWDKRKREAGKMAIDSPLLPRIKRRLGKAQFNWAPTGDLRQPWPVSLFVWGTGLVTLLAILAAFLVTDAYSPGALSTAHARSDFSLQPAYARTPNASSCTTCHALQGSMSENCSTCHTTAAFEPSVSVKHRQAGIGCLDCHGEHFGRDFRPAAIANVACLKCHRDGSGVVSKATGAVLRTPHGGTFGYPVKNGLWSWDAVSQKEWERRGLAGATSQFTPKEQFHLVHVGGRQQGRSHCTDCHVAGFEGAAVSEGVRQSCAACHGATGAQIAEQTAQARLAEGTMGAATPGPLCVSCHAQHGEEKELRASLRSSVKPRIAGRMEK